MNIIVDGLLTNYELTGKGKLIVLLHGWGDSLRGMSGLQTKLSKKYQVLSIDLPGFGATQPPTKAWNLDNYAAFIKDALIKLDLKQPYAVIGHSNGGAVTIRGIALGLFKPSKVVLLASAGVRNGQKSKRSVLKFIAKLGNLATIWMPERYRSALRKSLYGVAGSDMMVVPELKETFRRTVRQDVQADAAKLNVPALLIYAAKDTAVPLQDGQTLHRLIKGSKLEIIADSEHFVHQDQPEQVYNLIQEFLA